MENQQLIELLREELPGLLRRDRGVREWVLEVTRGAYAEKGEVESRFDRLLQELQQDREKQTRKWEVQERQWAENQQQLRQMLEEGERRWAENQQQLRQMQEEGEHKWAENQQQFRQMQEEGEHKWAENQQQFRQTQASIEALVRKHDSTIGALGARWGLSSEQAFRQALAGILADSFGVEVLQVTEYDDAGEVFGRPEQVELDVIIQDGTLILVEIKSSISKAEMYTFSRKVVFYEQRHGRQAARKLVISPMVEEVARGVARRLGIEVYSRAEEPIPGGRA